MASIGQNYDQVNVSDGGGLDGRKLECDNSESSNHSSKNLTVAKEARRERLCRLLSECKQEMLTNGTGKRKAPESSDTSKDKEKELELELEYSFLKEKWPATEDNDSFEEIMEDCKAGKYFHDRKQCKKAKEAALMARNAPAALNKAWNKMINDARRLKREEYSVSQREEDSASQCEEDSVNINLGRFGRNYMRSDPISLMFLKKYNVDI